MRFYMSKSVRILSLDAMNTIIGLKEPPGSTYARFAEEYGVRTSPQVLQSRFRPAFKEMEISYPCYGFDSFGPTTWWTKLIRKCFGEDSDFGDDEAFDDMTLRIYDYYSTKEPWELLEHDVLQQLDRLRSRGLAISITSNFDSRLRSVLLDFGILNHIDYIALSGELGVAKPDPRVFRDLSDFFNLGSPRELLHIGDSIDKDIQGAADFGAHYCLYDSAKTEKLSPEIPVISNLGDLGFEK